MWMASGRLLNTKIFRRSVVYAGGLDIVVRAVIVIRALPLQLQLFQSKLRSFSLSESLTPTTLRLSRMVRGKW
ncbi:hypothetical protein LINGRAHAP2_LOCUS10363 [Linum grandiflorum]